MPTAIKKPRAENAPTKAVKEEEPPKAMKNPEESRGMTQFGSEKKDVTPAKVSILPSWQVSTINHE